MKTHLVSILATIFTLSLVLFSLTGVSQAQANPFKANTPLPETKLKTKFSDHTDSHPGIDGLIDSSQLNGLGGTSYLPVIAKYAYTCGDRPLMLWPHNGETLDTLIPQYRWDTCDLPGAMAVDLQISPNPDMSNWVLGLSSFPTGQGVFDSYQNLTANTTYYCQIRAVYDNDSYGPSSVGSFRTPVSGTRLPSPVLISPANNSSLPDSTVTLKWQAVSGAQKYQLVVFRADGSMGYYLWVFGSEYHETHLEPNTKYYWYVSAVNHYAIGQPSEKWYFNTGNQTGTRIEPESSILDGTSGMIHWFPGSAWREQNNLLMVKK